MSKPKVIAILSQYPTLVEIYKQGQIQREVNGKLLSEVMEKLDAEKKDYWSKVETELKNLGIVPPDFDESKVYLSIRAEEDCIVMGEKTGSGPEELLELLKRVIPDSKIKVHSDNIDDCDACKDYGL